MSDGPEPTYPLFASDRDGWMKRVSSEKELGTAFEEIDILDDEYTVWDADGRPVTLSFEAKRVRVLSVAPHSDADRLRAAILEYAELEGHPAAALPAKGKTATDLWTSIAPRKRSFWGLFGFASRPKDWKKEYVATAELIERFVRGDKERAYGEWDDFTSVPVQDAFLDRIRLACSEVFDLYPATAPKKYCSEAGFERLMELARELRAKAAETST
jgi:hypothetical protein